MPDSPVVPNDQIRYDWGEFPATNPPPSSDSEWNELVQRGEKLLRMMIEPTETSKPSTFTDFPDVYYKWGYDMCESDSPDLGLDGKGVATALETIGASLSKNDWLTHEIRHIPDFYGNADIRTYQVGNRTYRATGASYLTAINVNDGIVM
ncbi:Nn.00g006320.m01.CDS01 [Neocucurbitaria sp. VM-36]